ncbi:MAG TPA: RNA polymerase sigma factor [Gaiellaceae bacterium]|nr:RNA polymerase sigma factor [Gaiellaceae bacterium]
MEASRAPGPLRRLARRGRSDDRSFEQLYRRHARDVYQYALAVLSNPADAEDVTQTTFLNAYRAYQKGERPQKPHNWLIAIAHNVCRMRWRQAGARPREVALEDAPEPVALDQERPDLDEVLTALAQLSFNQRAALVMRELEGRSYQEIAEILGVSVAAVEALLFRARRRLQVGRTALGALTTVPLPGSLAGLFGGGGGAVAAGGAALGTDLVLKAAAVVVVGAAVAGAGYKTVKVVDASGAAGASLVAPAAHQRATHARKAAHRVQSAPANRRTRRAPRTARTAGDQASRPTAPSTSASSSPAAGQPASQATPSSTAAVSPPLAPPPVVVTTPALPSVPPPPPLPVELPPVPPLPPPPPPVTVTVPPLPPPPPLP